jgi:hypothetical protein
MAIEWGTTPYQSNITHFIHDNTGKAPTDVMQAGAPFAIHVTWDVPAELVPFIGTSDVFRLRAYSESIGPGPEIQVGPTVLAPGVVGQTRYDQHINVAAGTLPGEGQAFGGDIVSGCYKIVVVMQHLNGGVPTTTSGCSDDQPLVMFKAP